MATSSSSSSSMPDDPTDMLSPNAWSLDDETGRVRWKSAKPLPKPDLKALEPLGFEAQKAAVLKYKSSWLPTDPDEIEEMLNSMPLFSTQRPEKGKGPSDDFDALDTFIDDATSPEERAVNFKETGNEAFALAKKEKTDVERRKLIGFAITYYSQALAVKGSDKVVNSVIHSNRALLQSQLGNHGHAVTDCMSAIKLNAKNVKAYFRAASACIALKKYKEAMEFCQGGMRIALESTTPDKDGNVGAESKDYAMFSKQLKKSAKMLEDQTAKETAKETARKERQAREAAMAEQRTAALMAALKQRHIRMGELQVKHQSSFAGYESKMVVDESTGRMVFPVVFLYPEYTQSDFVRAFDESSAIQAHLDMMFAKSEPTAPWDKRRDYACDGLSCYYAAKAREEMRPADGADGSNPARTKANKPYAEQTEEEKCAAELEHAGEMLVCVDTNLPLLDVLQQDDYVIPGIPMFYFVVTNSRFHKEFVERFEFVISVEYE